MTTKLTKHINKWVSLQHGWFRYRELDEQLGIVSKKDKALRRATLKRLVDRHILVRPSGIPCTFSYMKRIKIWRQPQT